MTSVAEIVAQQEEGLALLFERGLELALQVQADAMAAGAPDERARLALSFQRLSRSVRQTAALRTKLAAEAGRAERSEGAEVIQLQKVRVERRKDEVRAAVRRLIWTEAEGEAMAEDLKGDLEDLLEGEGLSEAFASEALETQVQRILDMLGIVPPGQGGEQAMPTEGGEAREPDRPAPHPPLRDSSPSGGALGGESFPRDNRDDGYWNST